MSYLVHELFLSLQGEGLNSGRVVVFLRFAGCNLWSGIEEDRSRGRGGCSRWCDTDFFGTDGPLGGRYESPEELAAAAKILWPEAEGKPMVVLTGGEPLLQVDVPLVKALHDAGFCVALESNGTIPVPPGIDWICISPKSGANLRVRKGDELKFVYPQEDMEPADFEHLDFKFFILQPLDGPEVHLHTQKALDYCLQHPRWRLGLQIHKILNLK